MSEKELTISFKCSYCGETLPFDRQHGGTSFVCNEFHECFGESPGLIAWVENDKVETYGIGEVEIVVG